jgi:hypothetical protein
MGTCDNCGVELLRFCPHELTTERKISWKCISYVVVGTTADGKEKNVSRYEYKDTTPSELVDFLRPKLLEFIQHNYFAQWQERQFKKYLKDIPADVVLSCIDFSENYAMRVQNEIQDMHWFTFQMTVLVHITYRVNPDFVAGIEKTRILKEVHYYISNEKDHDTLFVQHAFQLHWNFLTENGCFPKQHQVWSDGCAAQFKSARSWYFISRYQKKTTCEQLPKGWIWSLIP